MSMRLDHQLQEQIPHDIAAFPVTFYCDELAALPNRAGLMHWHPYFEIATAKCGVLDYQVGQRHLILEAGDSIFVNENMLHGIRQLSGESPDPMPNLVFSGTVVAPEHSTIYQNYIRPIAACDALPFVVFQHDAPLFEEVNRLIRETYGVMQAKGECYELMVQRRIGCILNFSIAISTIFRKPNPRASSFTRRSACRKCCRISTSIFVKRSRWKK